MTWAEKKKNLQNAPMISDTPVRRTGRGRAFSGNAASGGGKEGVMIITRTPFACPFSAAERIWKNFLSGTEEQCCPTTFDKYCYVTVRHLPRFFSYSTELSYSRIERVSSVDEICHPAIRNAMKMLDIRELRLTYEADPPGPVGPWHQQLLRGRHASRLPCPEGKVCGQKAARRRGGLPGADTVRGGGRMAGSDRRLLRRAEPD